VSEGTRTPDRLDHNQELYQLSYAHRGSGQCNARLIPNAPGSTVFMADLTARDTVLVKYLNEAYGKEKQLETVLQAQIGRTQNMTIKKRLREHLKETKAHARGVSSRIKALGGKADAGNLPGPDALGAITSLANKATAAAKGPIQVLRGTGVADNELRNVRDSFWNEAEEIAHYTVIEAVADKLGDKETAKLAKGIRREEEKMQAFLGRQLVSLSGAVVRDEVPAKERKPAGSAPSRRRRTSSSSRSASSTRSTAAKRSTPAKRASSSSRKSSGSSRSTGSRRSSTSRSSSNGRTTSRSRSSSS
jgi:ferritin-like metal-binding protein YciE